jgi:predicted AAA+ superfamily ATPase
VLPFLDQLRNLPFIFSQDFGLEKLPESPGILHIRGAKLYGKSTWLEQQVKDTVKQFGPGSALYISGDAIGTVTQLLERLIELVDLFPPQIAIKRIFVDDITCIEDWQTAVQKLLNNNKLDNILLITTGTKNEYSDYILTHIAYPAFYSMCSSIFGADTLYAYVLSGGTALGANCLAVHGKLPEHLVENIHTWLFKELADGGKSRVTLIAILTAIYRFAPNPVGQSKISRESGLTDILEANGYTKFLIEHMILSPIYPYDVDKKITKTQQECKYHFTNLLIAMCLHPRKPRTIAELKAIPGATFAAILEWLVAQELWRRACVASKNSSFLNFWQNAKHEIDFVVPDQNLWLEIKSGKEQASNLLWFTKHTNHNQILTVINQNKFATQRIKGITIEDFLLENCVDI